MTPWRVSGSSPIVWTSWSTWSERWSPCRRACRSLAGSRVDADLLGISEEVERLTWDLRDQVLNIRMLPIGGTFTRFKRLVRDLGTELDKDVVLITEGGDTELDKTVIDQLNDPLVHLVRNSIGHGIESPEVRQCDRQTAQGA